MVPHAGDIFENKDVSKFETSRNYLKFAELGVRTLPAPALHSAKYMWA